MIPQRDFGYFVLSLVGFALFAVTMPWIPWRVVPDTAHVAVPVGQPPPNRLGDYYVSEEAFAWEFPSWRDRGQPHRVLISRWADNPQFLRLAESLLPPRDTVLLAVPEQQLRRYGYPQRESLWWTHDFDRMRIPFAINSLAVKYYLDLSEQFATGDFSATRGLEMHRTSLEYEASLQHMDTYVHSAQVFEDVFVAHLHLRWEARCGGTCALWIDKRRVVVLSPSGELLAVFGDENTPYRIS